MAVCAQFLFSCHLSLFVQGNVGLYAMPVGCTLPKAQRIIMETPEPHTPIPNRIIAAAAMPPTGMHFSLNTQLLSICSCYISG